MKIRPTCLPHAPICTSTNAAASLLMAMKCLSYENFGTAWAQHLDKRLWKEMRAPSVISPVDANVLKYLSHLAGGWWSWNRADATGPTFLPTASWMRSLEA